MRRRNIRVLIFTLLVFGLALACLGFKELHVNVPGFPTLDRVGNGPLGLKLGLDLSGGASLGYQADVDPRVEVTMGTTVDMAKVLEILEELDLEEFSVISRNDRAFMIMLASLDDIESQDLESTLIEKLGFIESFQVNRPVIPTNDDMEGVVKTIKRRVNLFGTDEPIIQRFGDDRIIVQLPGITGSQTEVVFDDSVDIDVTQLDNVLIGLGFEDFTIDQNNQRSFRIETGSLDESRRSNLKETLEKNLGLILSFQVTSGLEEAKALIGQTAQLEFKERTCQDSTCTIFVDEAISDPSLSGDDLSDAFASTDNVTGEWVVNIQFNSRGSDLFSDLTQRISQQQDTKRIVILLDGEELIVPVARAWIRDGRSQISGSSVDPFSREEANNLTIQLKSGSLPVSLKLIQESDVDALLGSESLRISLIAGLVGLGLVVVFMVVYYRIAGVVASFSLIFYSVLILALFKVLPVTLTLSGIGGFILSIGMAVDANILIFERMKEEMRIGRTLASSMEVGFSRAWPAIRDSNVSTFITCGILLWFGNRLGGELVTGFALTLFIGVAVSMFTAVVVSRNLLQLAAWTGLGHKVNLFTPEGIKRPVRTLGGR
jgi:preprotein translocase subunit SecD